MKQLAVGLTLLSLSTGAVAQAAAPRLTNARGEAAIRSFALNQLTEYGPLAPGFTVGPCHRYSMITIGCSYSDGIIPITWFALATLHGNWINVRLAGE